MNPAQRLIHAALISCCVASHAADSLTPAGTWNGKALFSSAVLGDDDPASLGTFDLILTITVYGDVSGGAAENQCSFVGKASPASPGSSVASLTITLAGCANPGYNGRYQGTMTPTKVSEAKFQIGAMHFDRELSGAARRNTIASTMTR